MIQGIKYAKYVTGKATKPRASPKGVKGIIVKTAIPVKVRRVSDVEA